MTSRYQVEDRAAHFWKELFKRWEVLLLGIFVMIFVFNSLHSDHFLDPYNLADSTFNFSEKALLALPMALLIICREIDLSVAAIMALSSMAMGLANQHGLSAYELAAIGIGTGVLCGLMNGVLVTKFRLPSIVVTIGTMSLFRGIASVVLGDQAFTNYPTEFGEWGQGYAWEIIPKEFIVFLVAIVVFSLLLHATTFGRRLFAIGNNPIASRFTGIRVEQHKLFLFVLMGAMAGLASVLLTARIGSTRPNMALGWELEAITMVILGGVSIAGGVGTMLGVVIAIFTMGMVTYGMSLDNIPGIIMTILVGFLLLVTITVPAVLRLGTVRKE